MSLPTTSDPAAMRDYPNARRAELDTLLSLINLRPGMTVLDLQAAGGFVADAVHAAVNGEVTCICVEPSDALSVRISSVHRVVADPVDRLDSIESASCDLALGLAGLHHSMSIPRTLAEVHRVLRPDGQFAVCDVAADSNIAKWLNQFVNRHNPSGHQGAFLTAGELHGALVKAGFGAVDVTCRTVPWRFADPIDARVFFRGLFGLQCDEETLTAGITKYLTCSMTESGYRVDWSLLYARGSKIATISTPG